MKENMRIIADRCRNVLEFITKTICEDKKHSRTQVREQAPNQKDILHGRKIRNTVVWRTVREIPFGIEKTDGSRAQLRPEQLNCDDY